MGRAIEYLEEIVNRRHEFALNWQKEGRKLLGYFCSYVPEELIYAAGVLPLRILGAHETTGITEPYIFSMFCPFCRDCLTQGLKGDYDYLDGVVATHSCMHMRQVFVSWQYHLNPGYDYYLFFPHHVQSPHAQTILVKELGKFKASLESWLGKVISEEDLAYAIEVYNINRQLLHKLYALRQGDPPLISGAKALEVALAGQLMDKLEHNQWVEKLLEEASTGCYQVNKGIRLMLIGSCGDNISFVKLLESLGANVVIDDYCTGSRYFWNEVKRNGDSLPAIAYRYLNRPPCPHKDLVIHRRIDHLLALAKSYQVEGVIFFLQKFCDPHEFDIPVLETAFKEAGLPVLCLEADVILPEGQFRTRLEAFLEIFQLEV